MKSSSIYVRDFVRCDYKELVELTLIYLSGNIPSDYKFNRPGALHKFRWMSRLLYSLKLVLLSERILCELPKSSVYIQPSSWSFFKAIDCTADLILKPVDEWSEDPNYGQAKDIVDSMEVVNDGAERGVKLGSHFLEAAKGERRLQNVLQVEENDRKTNSNQRKRQKKL